MKRLFVRPFFLFLLVFLLTSCGNFDKDNTTAASMKAEALQKQHPGLHTVEILDMQFRPATLVVKKGDTVVWVNQDMLAHDVTEEIKKTWASGRMESGATWQRVMDESADYFCSLHAVMKGKIIVRNTNQIAGR